MTRNEESLQALFSGKELIKSDYDLNDGYDTNFNFMKIDQFTLLDEFKKIGYRLMDYWRSDEDLFFSVIHDNTETPFCYNEGTGDLFAGSKYLCIDNVSGEKELVDTVKWYEEGGWKTIESSRRPIKSDVIIKFEYKDKKYGNPNARYTQTAIYPSVNEFKKIMDENNTEFKIIRVTPLK